MLKITETLNLLSANISVLSKKDNMGILSGHHSKTPEKMGGHLPL